VNRSARTDLSFVLRLIEAATEAVDVEMSTADADEYKVSRADGVPAMSESLHGEGDLVGHRDGAAGAAFRRAGASFCPIAFHAQGCSFNIDVLPAKCQALAEAKASEGEGQDERGVGSAAATSGADDRVDLVGRQVFVAA